MSFAQVKTDPFQKGTRRRRSRFELWSEAFWRRLCKHSFCNVDALLKRYPARPTPSAIHAARWRGVFDGDLAPWTIQLIRDENSRLYGESA